MQVKDVWFNYNDGTNALKGINLLIPENSKTVLLGENGAGKSTLLLHFNALHLPNKGQIFFKDTVVNTENEEFIRTKIGLVFQDPDDQIFASSVYEDVAFGPLNMGLGLQEVNERVNNALKIVGMYDLRNKAPHHLSYGQKKRVAIAGVLAMDPEVIILDEPAAYLDPSGQDVLWCVLDELHAMGKTILVATHDVNMAAEWANHVIILKEGQTLLEGSPQVLVNEKIIAEAHLHLPIVARLYKKLYPHESELPCNIDQAVKALCNKQEER